MDEWTHARVHDIRDRMTPADDETLWVLFLDDPQGEPVTGMAIDGGADYDVECLRGLAQVLDGARPAAVLLAVTRESGTPRPTDLRILEGLRELLFGPTDVLDLVVVGRHSACSAALPV